MLIFKEQMTYNTPELANLLGIPVRLLQTWHDKNWLLPSIKEASGHGTRRIWSHNDLERGLLVKQLSRLLNPTLVHQITAQFKSN